MTPRLEEANAAFYEVFEACDLDRMAAAWVGDERVWCTHPGTDTIIGWDAVRRSWAAIFATTVCMQFIVTDVVAHESDTLGVVTCTEHIIAGIGKDLDDSRAVATNVFLRAGAGWKMLGHHASPILRPQILHGRPDRGGRPGGAADDG